MRAGRWSLWEQMPEPSGALRDGTCTTSGPLPCAATAWCGGRLRCLADGVPGLPAPPRSGLIYGMMKPRARHQVRRWGWPGRRGCSGRLGRMTRHTAPAGRGPWSGASSIASPTRSDAVTDEYAVEATISGDRNVALLQAFAMIPVNFSTSPMPPRSTTAPLTLRGRITSIGPPPRLAADSRPRIALTSHRQHHRPVEGRCSRARDDMMGIL
jgi:hypothetical protein